MPCRSDYMDPTDFEKNLSIVYELLDELKTGKLSENFGSGYHPKVYNKGLTKDHLDKKTRKLCSKLQNTDVSKYSLELQMWWRDHQKADKKRLQSELESELKKKDLDVLLSKLTEYERKLLGY